MPACDRVPLTPEVGILGFQERRDERVLVPEVAIEARLCDAGFLDNEVHADGMNAVPIEELRCGREDSVANRRRFRRSRLLMPFHHRTNSLSGVDDDTDL